MLRLGWLTDIHLNFISQDQRMEFYGRVRSTKLDAVLIGGDIGEADSVQRFLSELEDSLEAPIYFVLGNHDFYGGSIVAIRERLAQQALRSRRLCWLSSAGVVKLTDSTALVGHDGWADGRLGHSFSSEVLLSDYFLIQELPGFDKPELFRRLNALGDEAAQYLRKVLSEALESFSNVILLTHVPPFRESCWYQGRVSDDDFLPHFACQAVGDVLLEMMEGRPHCNLTALCGHTHSPGFAEIRDNLHVYTGGADYGAPIIQQIFEV